MPNTSYNEMDPELRKEVARDSIKKTTFLRVLISALMIGVTIYLKLGGIAAVVMVFAALLNLATLIPVWVLMSKNMKDREEKPEDK